MKFIKRVVIGWLAVTIASMVAVVTVKKAVPAFGDPDDDEFSLVAAMGGQEFASTAENLRSGKALALMGGIEIDLTEANLNSEAILRLRAVMGGIEVVVPSTWRVEVVAREFMGEVDSNTGPDAPDVLPDDAPLLVVHGTATMGGIEISTPEAP